MLGVNKSCIPHYAPCSRAISNSFGHYRGSILCGTSAILGRRSRLCIEVRSSDVDCLYQDRGYSRPACYASEAASHSSRAICVNGMNLLQRIPSPAVIYPAVGLLFIASETDIGQVSVETQRHLATRSLRTLPALSLVLSKSNNLHSRHVAIF